MRKKRICGRAGLVAVVALGITVRCLVALTTTTTSLVVSSGSIMLGQLETLTATVTPTPAVGGNVTFYDGATILGVAAVSGNMAVFKTKVLPAGLHTLTAYYGGDVSDAASSTTPAFPTVFVQAKPANTFLPAVNYVADKSPISVAVASFGSSKLASLAIVNNVSNDVSVLLGNGDGTFKPAVNYPVGMNPRSVAVGDFDGDGEMDLAVTNEGGNVSILLGKANGTFKPAKNYPAGATPYGIAVADFDGDGIADLAVVNDNVGVSFLKGNGDGTFQLPITDTSVAPALVVAADFDGDGKADLAVTNPAGTVTILLGKGDGTFTHFQDYTVGQRPFAIAVGDFNGDTIPDLAVTDYGGFLWVLIGAGGGTFDTPVPYTVGAVPSGVAVGDFDGDGNLDLVVTSSYSNTVNILLGDGHGAFRLGENLMGSGLPCAVGVGEFNGDERTDLAIANFFVPGSVGVLLSDEYSISATSGGGQSVKMKINPVFPLPLVVTVKNSLHTAVIGAAVTFTAPSTGASASFSPTKTVTTVTETTVAGGKATSPTLKANGTAGTYFVEATLGFGGATAAQASFMLSNN